MDIASASEVLGAPVLPSVMVKTEGFLRELCLGLLLCLCAIANGSCNDVVVNVMASVMRPLKIGNELALLRNCFMSAARVKKSN